MATYEDVISELLSATHHIHPERISDLLAERLPLLGLRDAIVYLADLEQRLLIPLGVTGQPPPSVLAIDDSPAGAAFRSEVAQETSTSAGSPARRLWVPLVDGAERLGVLAVTVSDADPITCRRCGDAATIAAAMIVSKWPYGDRLVLRRRVKDMVVAAEMRWDMLPPLTYVNDQIGISARVEPAYEIAGDTFDYAINGDVTHLAILDAMGHGLEASRMANLAVAVYRHARRQARDLVQIGAAIDAAIAAAFGTERFVTGQLALLDTATGHMQWTNAGHPQPLLLRAGEVSDLTTTTSLPFGLGSGPSTAGEVALAPGDTVMFFTDGVTESRSTAPPFGRERLAELFQEVSAYADPLAETNRRLCHAVVDHHGGHLHDDATLLLVSWKGGRAAANPSASGGDGLGR